MPRALPRVGNWEVQFGQALAVFGDHAAPCNYLRARNCESLSSNYLFGNPYLVPLVDPATRLIFPVFSSFFSKR